MIGWLRSINRVLDDYAGLMRLVTPIVILVLGWLIMHHGHGQISQVIDALNLHASQPSHSP